MQGFLTEQASLFADLSLVSIWILGLAAALGGIQARRRKFSVHCPIMAAAGLLNWIPMLLFMLPRWLDVVQGQDSITGSLADTGPLIHGIIGGVIQLLITYTIIRMYWIKELPPRQPVWLMRSTLTLWALSVLSGSIIYGIRYL